MSNHKAIFAIVFGMSLALVSCAAPNSSTPTATPPTLAEVITLYNWAEYMPQSVLDAFTAEYGVRVNYLTYDTVEEAEQTILDGGLAFDIAVVDNDSVGYLVSNETLVAIDYRNVPNFRNISANFRDLGFDPHNQYSVPFNWGTTGLIVRSDLVNPLPTRWTDLWDPGYTGRIAVRHQPYELINVALLSLGYPANSEDPAHVDAAQDHLIELKKSVTFVEPEERLAITGLLTGEIWILLGWQGDALRAVEQNPMISYILPQEGTLLWGDAFVISANSAHKATAELFIDFILRPEVSAQIVNEYHYPTTNEATVALLDPAIRDNPILFPPLEDIRKGEWYLPLSPEGDRLYERAWTRFMGAE